MIHKGNKAFVLLRAILTLSVFAAEDPLAISSAKVTVDLHRLYQALGGGWNPRFREDIK